LLSDFSAYEEYNRVVVQWETASEVGTVGFNLLRSDEVTGEYHQVNEQLLPGLLRSPQGGTYRYVDPSASPGGTYSYKLEEAESNGTRRTYSPLTVEAKRDGKVSSAVSKINNLIRGAFTGTRGEKRIDLPSQTLDSTYTREAHSPSPRKIAPLEIDSVYSGFGRTLEGQESGERARVVIEEKGLYSLSADEIAPLLGLATVEDVEDLIANNLLQLSANGNTVAYMPEYENSGILFYGEEMESIYTEENIYWLEEGEGLEMERVGGEGPGPAAGEEAFAETIHAEEEHYAVTSLFNDPQADYWVWNYIVSGDGDESSRSFTLVADGVAPVSDPATLTVHLKGGSNNAASPDHHAVITLNGTQIGESYWEGTESNEVSLTFSQSLLNDGENTVGITGVLDPGSPYSIFHVDSFDLAYQRHYGAMGDLLHCRGDSNNVVTISNFSIPEILLFDLADAETPRLIEATTIDGTPGNYRLSFEPVSQSTLYCAVSADAVRAPDSVTAVATANLKGAENGADYIIITTEELSGTAQLLADYRESQGLEALVVTLKDIINEFNYGISSPEAIRDFLSHTYHYWRKAPRYVVLAGDGTYDYKDNKGYGDNIVPPLMTGSPGGLFASDTALGDVEGNDGVPEMAVGRLSVINVQELEEVINKIIGYEAAVSGPWMKRALMVADDPDGGGDFPSDSDDIAALLPDDFAAEKIYLSEHTTPEAWQLLLDGINSGAVLMNYIGHAGLDRLAQEALLTMGDVPSLTNEERLPVVTAMTCAVGRFAVPGYDCLAEELLLKVDGGAAAVWGPTGLSINSEAKILAEQFYLGAFGEHGRNILGEIILGALEGYGNEGNDPYILRTYNLIGDPALRLHWEDAPPPPPTDTDGDGLSDKEEVDTYGSDPFDADTDDDGLEDGVERDYWGSDCDTNYDEDEITNNLLDPDSDNDGYTDYMEIVLGTSPSDGTKYPSFLRINFNPPLATPPPGFLIDKGDGYSPARSYGWQ